MKGYGAERVGWTRNSDRRRKKISLVKGRTCGSARVCSMEKRKRFKTQKKMKKPLDNGLVRDSRLHSQCSALPRLLREVHAAQQSLKAWLRVQKIQTRIRGNKNHPLVVIFVSPLKPRDRLVFLAEASVCLGKEKTGNILVPSHFSHFVDQFLGLVLPSFQSIYTGRGS